MEFSTTGSSVWCAPSINAFKGQEDGLLQGLLIHWASKATSIQPVGHKWPTHKNGKLRSPVEDTENEFFKNSKYVLKTLSTYLKF